MLLLAGRLANHRIVREWPGTCEGAGPHTYRQESQLNSAIKSGPNSNYDFGYDFNYALWTEGSTVTLCNVPWNNDYRDAVSFTDIAAVNAYIDSLSTSSVSITKLSQIKPNTPVKINVPFNIAFKYNYLRVSAPVQPIVGDVQRDYFYFITDVTYIAPNNTLLTVQLDDWVTFTGQWTLGQCYVERGHIGIANENAFDNYGRNYLTIPEGMDIGSDMQVVKTNSVSIMRNDFRDGSTVETSHPWDILVCATGDLIAMTANPGTKTSPNRITAQGGNFFGLPSGANYYVFNGTQNDFQLWLTSVQSFPWITQGIISISVIPPITRYIPGFTYGSSAPVLAPTQVLQARTYDMITNWRNDPQIATYIGSRFANLKKLFTYPYMAVELTTFGSTPLLLKPEAYNGDNMTVVERINPIPPNQRVSIAPLGYNKIDATDILNLIPGSTLGPGLGDDQGEFLDLQTLISNFPTLAIVNDMAISYLASNAHSIAYQYASADWSQQRALQGNQVSYDQASSGMTLNNQLASIAQGGIFGGNAIDQNLRAQTMGLGAISQAGGGVAGGVGGVAAGAALGALTAGAQSDAANQVANLGAAQSARTNRAQQANMGMVRDTNKDYADWAARGDYANSIAATDAKVQDAKAIQPSTSGQVGGEAFNIINNLSAVFARVKMIDPAAIARIGNYWLRFGYQINRFIQMPSNLMVMEKFTYWKLTQTYITSASMPETHKQTIRGILEKGVTLWASPADIGNIDIADNNPLPGITI